MRYGSLCSGIEAATVAFHPLGWEAAWYSEIEPFPCAVLDHHYPNIPNHGDMTTIAGRILSGEVEAPDMICGGTPCQAFSVAGLRKSLDDDRGNLTLQFIKICDATDSVRRAAGKEPCWILYENVPGLLSTRDNAFGAFLGGLCGRDAAIHEPADGWTSAGVVAGPTRVAAWRILNAEHFGLAQRRQRVFVLALGGAGKWAAADALLPLIESGRWHPAPRRGKGEGITPCLASGAENSGGAGIGKEGDPMFTLDTTRAHAIAHTLRGEGFEVAGTIGAQLAKRSSAIDGNGAFVPLVMAHGQANAEVVSDGSPSLTCNHEAPILVAEAIHENQRGEISTNETAGTLGRGGGKPGQGYQAVCVRMREGKEGGGKGPLLSEDQSLTLATANDQVLFASLSMRTRDGVVSAELGEEGIANALRGSNGGRAGEGAGAVLNGMQVRRLTPVEAERLQGFPDGYTAIPWRGKPADQCPDGPRYKALGNSWAVPCARYIGERIKAVLP